MQKFGSSKDSWDTWHAKDIWRLAAEAGDGAGGRLGQAENECRTRVLSLRPRKADDVPWGLIWTIQIILLFHSVVLLFLMSGHLVPGVGSLVEVTFNTQITVVKVGAPSRWERQSLDSQLMSPVESVDQQEKYPRGSNAALSFKFVALQGLLFFLWFCGFCRR